MSPHMFSEYVDTGTWIRLRKLIILLFYYIN